MYRLKRAICRWSYFVQGISDWNITHFRKAGFVLVEYLSNQSNFYAIATTPVFVLAKFLNIKGLFIPFLWNHGQLLTLFYWWWRYRTFIESIIFNLWEMWMMPCLWRDESIAFKSCPKSAWLYTSPLMSTTTRVMAFTPLYISPKYSYLCTLRWKGDGEKQRNGKCGLLNKVRQLRLTKLCHLVLQSCAFSHCADLARDSTPGCRLRVCGSLFL